ncbi:hypothetical protein [Streptomyces sp. NPDC004726]
MGLDHASLSALAALGDATRLRIFEFIRQARLPVTREDVADSLGISRKPAAFPLDKPVAAGLLQAGSEASTGIRKVGRRPKVYEPVTEAIAVTIPERRYGMPADILTGAVELLGGYTAPNGPRGVRPASGEPALRFRSHLPAPARLSSGPRT